MTSVRTLTLLHAPGWPLSSRGRRWLARERAFVRLDVVAPGSLEAARRFPGLAALDASAGPDADLVAIADDGRVWRGASAWVMTLWALVAHRRTAARLVREGRTADARGVVETCAHGRRVEAQERSTHADGLRSPPPPGAGREAAFASPALRSRSGGSVPTPPVPRPRSIPARAALARLLATILAIVAGCQFALGCAFGGGNLAWMRGVAWFAVPAAVLAVWARAVDRA